ncbi:NAD(P)/FAD-dependent oxidoreductase [Fulvivirga lutimaris]|uniref:NAD(P)/FAD-dependent oxidoreductase n=1 Tax=Fulvivirga lutimaris TaxID=1819566 RepID=UPI0012BC71EB|nr:FAD-dependent oxidoreductase [Fulvivirga lutimaris]MTI40556.1 FAD-binding oxidoreductase [Fulvivirga lutimaris]
MLSYWEKESFVNYDHIIIGSGIVGLSTAISIKEKKPDADILVLERGILPTGASTKNAGFACFGSLTELLEDIKVLGETDTLALVNERWEGLKKLRERVGDRNMDYLSYGGYELMRDAELPYLKAIDQVNEMLLPLFKQSVFSIDDEKIKSFGFTKGEIKSIVVNPFEGQIHTGKMMKSLLQLAYKNNIKVLTGTEVLSFEDNGAEVSVVAKNMVTNSEIVFKTNKVAVCTNAFTNKLVHNLDINPGRGIVLVTKPLPKLPFQGVFHIDKGYYYFRNEGSRVIFGGGRNLDFEGETTTEFEVNDRILAELKKQLKEVILPNTPFEVDHTWAGIMAFGANKQPIYKQHSSNVHLGVRLGGMGVAIGSRMGEKLAEKML